MASQYEKFAPLDYTLSIFSTQPFVCEPIPPLPTAPSTSIELHGEWDATTAGGRPFYSTFMNNPQFHVTLTAPCRSIYFLLETENFAAKNAAHASLPVNLRAVLHTRERVCGLPNQRTQSGDETPRVRILTSGEYRPAFCFIDVPPAYLTADLRDLVLIPSTFEKESVGTFTLRVVSDPPSAATMSCRALPQEGFGMDLTTIHDNWDAQTGSAAGCFNFGCYTFNPKYLVHVPFECTLFARLLIDDKAASEAGAGSTPPSINVSIFESTSDGALRLSTSPKLAIASSENCLYVAGSPCGVVARPTRPLPAGWYLVVPSTFEPQAYAFELRIYSSVKAQVRAL